MLLVAQQEAIMRLSRKDISPVLAILLGGSVAVIASGALLLSFSDAPAPHNIVAPPPPTLEVEPPPTLRVVPRLEPPPQPKGLPRVEDGPIFTPMTMRPELKNRNDVIRALMREYPSVLRGAGIGGQVVVWFFISETGRVLDRRISRSSGHAQLDEAALKVADVYDFAPATNRRQAVRVWIQLPITFQVG
jgi:protein TonB